MSKIGSSSRRAMGRCIRWEDGIPYPEYRPIITKDNIKALITVAASLEYKPLYQMVFDEEGRPTGVTELAPGEEEFIGMSNAEVMSIKLMDKAAQGDMEAIKYAFDQTIGKPMQPVQQLNVSLTMQDVLREMKKEDAIEATTYEAPAIVASQSFIPSPFDVEPIVQKEIDMSDM